MSGVGDELGSSHGSHPDNRSGRLLWYENSFRPIFSIPASMPDLEQSGGKTLGKLDHLPNACLEDLDIMPQDFWKISDYERDHWDTQNITFHTCSGPLPSCSRAAYLDRRSAALLSMLIEVALNIVQRVTGL